MLFVPVKLHRLRPMHVCSNPNSTVKKACLKIHENRQHPKPQRVDQRLLSLMRGKRRAILPLLSIMHIYILSTLLVHSRQLIEIAWNSSRTQGCKIPCRPCIISFQLLLLLIFYSSFCLFGLVFYLFWEEIQKNLQMRALVLVWKFDISSKILV